MSQSRPSYHEMLHRPPPNLGEILPKALPAAGVGAAIGVGLVVVVTVLQAIRRDDAGDSGWDWWHLGMQALAWGFALAVVCFLGKLLASSRRLLDRSFYWFALTVTGVGFVILLWFIGSLAWESYQWFQVMPPLVEKQNQEYRAELAKYKDVDRYYEEKRKELEEEKQFALEDATSEKKQAVAEQWDRVYIPNGLRDAEKLLNDRELLRRSIREDTSPWSMFTHFMTAGASPEKKPQDAGIRPALIGSILIGLIAVVFAVPLGVGAAIYLEEYRAKGWLNKLIQVNIANLAAVPSVFYGILGAYIFVELIFKNLQGEMWTPSLLVFIIGQSNAEAFMHTIFGEKIAARNLLGGGLSLALLTLPVVIVASQEAIRAVPQSLRHAALALGATKWQSIWHHVLPQARSGILTGVILGLSRAIGEAAPLVMFGALTLVTYNPKLLTPFTVMPLQIFNWAGRSVEEWKYNAALASLILMTTLLMLNGAAIWLRQRSRSGPKAT